MNIVAAFTEYNRLTKSTRNRDKVTRNHLLVEICKLTGESNPSAALRVASQRVRKNKQPQPKSVYGAPRGFVRLHRLRGKDALVRPVDR